VDPSGHKAIVEKLTRPTSGVAAAPLNLLDSSKKPADGSASKYRVALSEIEQSLRSGVDTDVVLAAVLATNSPWVENQLKTLGWQVYRHACVDTTYMYDLGASGWTDESVHGLYPDGQIRYYTSIELVKLPPKYASNVVVDQADYRTESTGPMDWLNEPIYQVGYHTLEDQQYARQFFIGLAVSPAVVGGCTLGALFCVAGAGVASNVTYVASTTSVGMQPDSMTAGKTTLTAMAVAAAPYAIGAGRNAIQEARAASNAAKTTTGVTNAKPPGGYSNATSNAPVNAAKPVVTGGGSSGAGAATGVRAWTPEELAEIASTIKHAPDVRALPKLNNQVIAVGVDHDGQLVAAANTGSYFTAGQRALLEELDIRQAISRTVQGTKLHAEENLLGSVSDIVAVGTSKLEPCIGICRPLLDELGIPWASKP
jgi:hypothetical protein